jgi:tetratricopeptide (TPR) repeat protein
MFIRRALLLVTIVACFAAPDSVFAALEDKKWIEVRTNNFRVISVLNERKSVELARYLELFRVAVVNLTNIRSTDAPIPTNIYVVRGNLNKFGLDPNAAGVYMPSLRHNTMVVRDSFGMKETSIILHEYVHFLIRNQTSLHYPMWFDEGFAEYLSASRVRRGYFEIGLVPEHRLGNLNYSQWIPMRKILAPERYERWSRERKSMFYAEAWALVHYLQGQPETNASFSESMAVYLKRIESGSDSVEAFGAAFGIDDSALDRSVKRYLTKGKLHGFQYDSAQLLPVFQPKVTRLSKARVALAMAQLALQGGELDKAEHWFKLATADAQTRARAMAGLGDVLKFRGELVDAQPFFEEALRLAPDDAYCQLDIAEYWYAMLENTEDQSERERYLERAQEHLVAAWRLDDSSAETYAMLGATLLAEGRDYDRAIEMLEGARDILPSDLNVRLMLAKAYAATGRSADAIDAAKSVVAWAHSDSEAAEQAREILAGQAAKSEG